MISLLKTLKEKIFPEQKQEPSDVPKQGCLDNLIALGVLLWAVAEADEKFLPKEKEKIREVLKVYSNISDSDMPIVIRSIEEAALDRIDLYSFAREVGKNIDRQCKVTIIEDLFRVACSDKELSEKEHEVIRTISKLFGLDHKEFIDAKIRIKKSKGMDTVD